MGATWYHTRIPIQSAQKPSAAFLEDLMTLGKWLEIYSFENKKGLCTFVSGELKLLPVFNFNALCTTTKYYSNEAGVLFFNTCIFNSHEHWLNMKQNKLKS